MRKGTDKVTLDMLKELGACEDGVDFFSENHPSGGEYQAVLDMACQKGHPDYATWLLEKLGPTDDTMEVEEISTDFFLVYAGSISAKGAIFSKRGIRAGGGIRAGDDFGIFCGLRARSSGKPIRQVFAKTKPKNLIAGEYAGVWDPMAEGGER